MTERKPEVAQIGLGEMRQRPQVHVVLGKDVAIPFEPVNPQPVVDVARHKRTSALRFGATRPAGCSGFM